MAYSVADKYFREIPNSGPEIVPPTEVPSHGAGLLRSKYQKKVPWGDCVLAFALARALYASSEMVIA